MLSRDSCMENDCHARRMLEFSSDESNKPAESELLCCSGGEKSISEHQLTSLKEKTPEIGMEFDSEEAAHEFYNNYAKVMGFSIKRHTVHFDHAGKILDRTFCCSCQGKKAKDKRDVLVKSHRPETRTGCPALMKINRRYTGKFQVVNFVADHNGHDLVSPSKSHLLRSHRTMNCAQVSQIDDIDCSGIAPKAGFDLLARQVGGRENVGFIFEDYKNYLGFKRSVEMKKGDTGGVLEYLNKKQSEDPNFFYAIQVDEDDLITNIFWADAQMMADFTHFGDVVCFDTTYQKNNEGRPFALFVGVNHHKQTIVFGAALLYDETTPTFIWLFDTFSRAMSGKQSQTILTDQDLAMSKALEIRWPETTHRLCIWHIYQNAAMNLKDEFSQFEDLAEDFNACIFNYEEEEEFLRA